MVFFRILYPFFLPSGLFLVAGVVLLNNSPLPHLITSFISPFFVFIFTFTLLLGFRFKRNRLIFTQMLLVIALALSLLYPLQISIYATIALLLPINIALALLLPEKKISSPITAIYGSILLLQSLSIFWLNQFWPQKFTSFLNHPLPFTIPGIHQPGMAQLLSLLIALLLAGFCFYRRPQPFESAFVWAIILTVLPFHFLLDIQYILLFFSLAILTFLTGLLETSHNMAYRDELTGISGRRALNENLKRLDNRYALAMLDIDHFKKFNDTHGHEVGDQVLKMVAGLLARVSCNGDVFRYGGEEFTIVFPGKRLKQILPELERLRKNVEMAAFIPRGKDRPATKPKNQALKKHPVKSLKVRISIGAAEMSRDNSSPEQVLIAADKALYQAKQQGRNRVCT